MKYSVRLLQRAQNDLLQIQKFIADDSVTYAGATVDRLLDRIESLEEMPR